MQKATLDWGEIDGITRTWFSETLRELREKGTNTSQPDYALFVLVEYCLIVCAEYRDAAFDAFRNGRFYAGSNNLRPILEHAIHLWWCGSDRSDVSGRLDVWEKAAAPQHKKLCEAWRDMKPARSAEWKECDKKAAFWRGVIDKRKQVAEVPNLWKMAESLKDNSEAPDAVVSFYPVYRELSQSSHATLDLDEVFKSRDGALIAHARREMRWMMPVDALYVPLALVSAAHAFFDRERPVLGRGFQEAKLILDRHYSEAAQQNESRTDQ